MDRPCSGTKRDGSACGAAPLRDRPFCFLHDPESAKEAAEARRLGGIRRRREGTVRTLYDLDGLDSVEGIRRIIEIAAFDALAQDGGNARQRVLLAAAEAARRLLETHDLEQRLAAVEDVLRLGERSRAAAPEGDSLLDEREAPGAASPRDARRP